LNVRGRGYKERKKGEKREGEKRKYRQIFSARLYVRATCPAAHKILG
jgi:hypothetical protein